MKIYIVAEPTSWVAPYLHEFGESLAHEHDVRVIDGYDGIEPGADVSVFIGCTRIAKRDVLERSRHNLVVHQSDLPRGRGWSPLAWQILEGASEIPVCLFEAVEALDAGPVYKRDTILLEGHELVDELRALQAASAVGLVRWFVERYPDVAAVPQEGEPTFYGRRSADDLRLDPDRTIAAQFDLFRIADNEKYPAFFDHRGHRYVLRIEKAENPE